MKLMTNYEHFKPSEDVLEFKKVPDEFSSKVILMFLRELDIES